MPIYEYRCNTCEHHLEQNHSFSDEPLTTCPTCGGTLRKVFGSVGIVLKGSGFYRTDSRTSSTRTAASKENGANSTSSDGATSSDGSSSGGSPSPKTEPSSNGSSSAPSPASTGSSSSTGSTPSSS